MSNERIDLTQFEGITEGPWVSEEWDEGKILGPISERHRNNHPIVAVVGDGWWGDMMPECDANKRAMAAVPELIAELKRCYEELDKWTNYATYMENVDIDCHKDASAEAGFLWKCTDCGAHFELPENGIYECEFGCDASE
jgi:hypothetical protein